MAETHESCLARLWEPAKRVMVVALLIDLGVSCLGLGVQFLAIDLKAPPLVLGLLGTVGSIAYTLGCLVSGTISDRYGRKLPAALACLVAATTWLLMAPAGNPYQLLALTPISGLALSFLWPPMQAWLAEFSGSSPRRLNRNISLFNMAWTAGIMSGPLLAGFTWVHSRYLPFLMPVAFGFLAAWVVLKTPARGEGRETETPHSKASPELIQLFLLLAWVGNFASWYARGVATSIFPKLGRDLGFSHELVGILIFALGVAQLASFGLARLSERWHYHFGVLVAAEVLGLVGVLVTAVASLPLWIGLAFTAVGLCGGVTYVSSLTYALQGHAAQHGQRSGFHEAVLGLGVVLGPLVGGVLGQWFSMRLPFGACAVVFGAAILTQVALVGRYRRAQATVQATEAAL